MGRGGAVPLFVVLIDQTKPNAVVFMKNCWFGEVFLVKFGKQFVHFPGM
jgi:hypothetical protein